MKKRYLEIAFLAVFALTAPLFSDAPADVAKQEVAIDAKDADTSYDSSEDEDDTDDTKKKKEQASELGKAEVK
ncbi:MAG: hypothetical protein HZB76_02515 [Chlamydiae bacterium]|nr:hypothetical protein [Chlamydiota bacterium]